MKWFSSEIWIHVQLEKLYNDQKITRRNHKKECYYMSININILHNFLQKQGSLNPPPQVPPFTMQSTPPPLLPPPLLPPPFTTQKDYPSPTGGGTLTIMISWPWTLFTHLVKKKIHSTICWWFLSSKISNKSFKFIVLSKVSILMNLLIYV